jgi:hypothetical protein
LRLQWQEELDNLRFLELNGWTHGMMHVEDGPEGRYCGCYYCMNHPDYEAHYDNYFGFMPPPNYDY